MPPARLLRPPRRGRYSGDPRSPVVTESRRSLRAARHQRARACSRCDGRRRLAGRLGYADPCRFPYRRHDEQADPRLRILVAAARRLLRARIVRLLSGNEPGIEVIGEVATAEQALDACQDLRPDVVLADLGLSADDTSARRHSPAGGGVTGLLLSRDPGMAVVGLCEIGDEKLVASAMRAGARGCVDMGADGPELLRAVAAARRSCPGPCSSNCIAACRKMRPDRS